MKLLLPTLALVLSSTTTLTSARLSNLLQKSKRRTLVAANAKRTIPLPPIMLTRDTTDDATDRTDEPSTCIDSTNSTFLVNADVGEQDCAFLAENLDRFDYLCSFFDVAIACPATCNVCDDLDAYCGTDRREPPACDINEPTTECCSDSDCMESDTCQANVCVANGNPVFRLIWSGDDDLDLHVITPAGNEIFFGNPSADTGTLDQDDIPIIDGFPDREDWVENIFFPVDGSAPSGTYTYFVHNFSEQGDSADPWELRVLVGNEIVATQTGVLGNNEFSVEFTYEHTGTQI